MSEPTFFEMLEYVRSKNLTHFENDYMICKDLPLTLEVMEMRVKASIEKGNKPSRCRICLTEKHNLKLIYDSIKES